MNIQVLEKEEMKVVGISWSGTYSQLNTIPELFDAMKERIDEVPNQTNTSILIAPFHSRETELTYYVTTPVEKLENVPEGMVGFTIPRKNYVCTLHKGSLSEVENTYRETLIWMQEYGYELDDHALSLEVYKQKDLANEEEIQIELYLPVKTYGNGY
ncbi:GyrI-like domain-containing protein [Neobacillus niacini]|uniref:GyrI-like domain-containing protein n=1 Tax=Neobacillus niacini TaxID=86668 RepID=UPI0007ABE944|nr:GyrI-like domain-containing protein [Neobacillus niacini]MEC1521188.1 GyrI-like domain-containing protein [Neobacillus niacini]